MSGLGGLWGCEWVGRAVQCELCVCVCWGLVWVWCVGGCGWVWVCLTDTISTFNWYQRLVQNVGSPQGALDLCPNMVILILCTHTLTSTS